MRIFKQVSYVEMPQGWQTYVFPVYGGFRRYKLLKTLTELEQAKENCVRQGWKMTNATSLVNKMNCFSIQNS
ncbi:MULTISPECIES: hypothetical protein [Oscillatoriales]|uniref:Uncharacterized protein n=1 Tax=Aerosakkonema funiforme FACHB-1375 TaxID=2949571 RepID=A0A926VAM7_9CYAN|nr:MULTISPECIES: hypothetical protein [Oscillatoriales]MBD2180328.1 hypothetical protein [Aerosakkonema funiforme FACHB-1375]